MPAILGEGNGQALEHLADEELPQHPGREVVAERRAHEPDEDVPRPLVLESCQNGRDERLSDPLLRPLQHQLDDAVGPHGRADGLSEEVSLLVEVVMHQRRVNPGSERHGSHRGGVVPVGDEEFARRR